MLPARVTQLAFYSICVPAAETKQLSFWKEQSLGVLVLKTSSLWCRSFTAIRHQHGELYCSSATACWCDQ